MFESHDVIRAISNENAVGIVARHGHLRSRIDEGDTTFQKQDRIGG